jgi:RNA polymerase sigma factor (sigma-70 family)
MATSPIVSLAAREGRSDEDVIKRVLAGETGAYEIIMRRYNQRLYRVALSILKDEPESEDVTQETYVRAYEHLSQFAGCSKFSTWLTRIAVNEALARARRNQRSDSLDDVASLDGELNMPSGDSEKFAASGEMSRFIHDTLFTLAGSTSDRDHASRRGRNEHLRGCRVPRDKRRELQRATSPAPWQRSGSSSRTSWARKPATPLHLKHHAAIGLSQQYSADLLIKRTGHAFDMQGCSARRVQNDGYFTQAGSKPMKILGARFLDYCPPSCWSSLKTTRTAVCTIPTICASVGA